MEELLNKVSTTTGVPGALLDRALRARAAARGVSVEALLAEWVGEPVPEGAAAAPPAAAPVPAATPAPAPPPAEAPSGPSVSVLEPTAEPPAPPAVEAVAEPAAAFAGFPRWLAAAFVIIPLLAVSYALLAPNGPDCGSSGALAVDDVTGEAANCDGSEYGVEVMDFFSSGQAIYEARCTACHGAQGQGGAGPALAGGSVVVVFPSCDEHIDWVRVGTAGWTELTGRDSYGATEKPVGGFGQMPGFGGLSDTELAEVVLYERVAFGQQANPEAETDCGLDQLASG